MKGKHVNALLMEILMAVLLFALASVLILELFAAGYDLSARAERLDRAVNHARRISEQLYAAQDMRAVLAENGFEEQEAAWHFSAEDYALKVVLEAQDGAAGTLFRAEICVQAAGEEALTLPCVRYIGREADA